MIDENITSRTKGNRIYQNWSSATRIENTSNSNGDKPKPPRFKFSMFDCDCGDEEHDLECPVI